MRDLFQSATRVYLANVIAGIDKLGHFNHDVATTMAAVLVVMVLLAYWILKT